MSASIRKKRKYLLLNGLAILIPFVLIALTEFGLRGAGVYSDERETFIKLDGRPDYVGMNPEYAARYFNGFVPSVAYNPFLAEKDNDSFRVVVLGGSSVAGFPFQFYYGFPEAMARRLSVYAAGQNVEVINLGMTAVNSYTLWDIKDAVVAIEPDAIVVYAGHNEYYGAFGAGSTLYSLGNILWLKRAVLRLKHSVLYLALEKLLTGRGEKTGQPIGADDRTLMARVVRDAAIERGDPTYLTGLDQFKKNMNAVVASATNHGIPVFIGTLVSNLSGQAPLGSNEAAQVGFEEGISVRSTDRERADSLFRDARDLDNIRFRAPSDINLIIERIAENDGVTLVDLREPFAEASETGIPGFDLFVDHLHPTTAGYDLIGEVFFEAIKYAPGLRPNPGTWLFGTKMDPLAASHSSLLIQRLLADYPFHKGLSADEISRISDGLVKSYLNSGVLPDSLAAITVSSPKTIQSVLYEGLRASKALADTAAALGYYEALFHWQPFNDAFRREGVSYALSNPKFDALTQSLAALGSRRGQRPFFWNALGVIQLRSMDLVGADLAMAEAERIDPDSPVLLFNRARYYVVAGDTASAQVYFDRYQATQK